MTELFHEEDWEMIRPRLRETAMLVADEHDFATQNVEKAILDYFYDVLVTENFDVNAQEYIFDRLAEMEGKKVVI